MNCSEWGGGDSIQIKETAKRLVQRGHEVSIQNSDTPNIEGADVAHIFNCRVYESLKKQYKTCKMANVPIVISPIWINLANAIWGSRGTFAVLEKGILNGEQSIREDMTNIKKRKLSVVHNGNVYKYGSTDGAGLEWLSEVSEITINVEGILRIAGLN